MDAISRWMRSSAARRTPSRSRSVKLLGWQQTPRVVVGGLLGGATDVTRGVEFEGVDPHAVGDGARLNRLIHPDAGVAQAVAVARLLDELAYQLPEVVVEPTATRDIGPAA